MSAITPRDGLLADSGPREGGPKDGTAANPTGGGLPIGREGQREGAGLAPVSGSRHSAPAQAHPSWQYHDRFELWVDWLQRNSAGQWHPLESVLQRSFRTREDTLLQAERFIQRGEFPMSGLSRAGRAAPVTLMRNRRAALLDAFRDAEGDGVTLIREVVFPVGEYALAVKVTRERLPDEVRTTFAQPGNPLRSLHGQAVKLTVLIEHPYDVLSREEGLLDVGERAARVGGGEVLNFPPSATVVGIPYRSVTVAVPRGLLKKPLLYRFERTDLTPEG